MKARRGQVAIYLALVLVALALLMVANVNVFLAVRSKNRMMNAVDEAAIAAAKHQGYLLNAIGQMNVEHLKAAVLGEPWTDDEGVSKEVQMRKLAFLDPVDAIGKANDAAAEWGYRDGAEPRALEGFRDHISEILNNPDLYPPTDGGENLWHVYADKLASALGGSPAVLPGYMEMVNPGSSGLFANHGFYDVLAAKAWCWFSIGNNAQYLDGDPSQIEPYEVIPVEVPENSEVFSLHITYKTWMDSEWREEWRGSGFSEKWTNFVSQVTGILPPFTNENCYVASPTEVWAFYDDMWRTWSTTYNPDDFPIAGTIKPEYDVAGCVASCMMLGHIQQLGKDDEKRESDKTILVTAEAKPLGTVEDLEGGGRAPVTAYNRFIAASRPYEKIFTEAQLVLMGSVPRSPGCSMEPGWYDHVKKHSPQQPGAGCGYCRRWAEWSEPSFRAQIRSWLQQNADSCRSGGGGGKVEKGGYPYAH